MKQVPDQIFDQVLYRKDVPDMKMQVSGDPVLSGERLCEKTKQYVTFINHMNCLCKKFRKNQKINGDIVHTGGENFVCSILIQ